MDIKRTWMLTRTGERWFNDDAVTSWKQFLSDDAETFIGNRNDGPIDILFAVVVNATPVFMTLPGTRVFPV